MKSKRIKMHCVGCGRFVCSVLPDDVVSIACTCGAMAPILTADVNDSNCSRVMLPSSLVRAIMEQSDDVAHLEYFLGREPVDTPARRAYEEILRSIGCISEKDCVECRQRDPDVREFYEVVDG